MAQPPGDQDRLFVVEKAGRVRVLEEGRTLHRPFLDISDRVASEGEQGLFSIAFAPDYQRSGRFYVAYSDLHGTERIEGYRRSEDAAAVADPGTRESVLSVDHPEDVHWGGLLTFGPDRHLYVALGDGGPAFPPAETSTDLEDLHGKLLRIDPRPGGGYSIPHDNPFVGRAGRDEVFAYGLRNPWRYSFDSKTGALGIGDVGNVTEEEIDYVSAGRTAGADFGWPRFEGNARTQVDVAAPSPVAPVLTYPHASDAETGEDVVCAVTGGYTVRDPDLPRLDGRFIYADYCRGKVRSFLPRGGRAVDDRPVGVTVPRLSSFSQDLAGHIYITSLGGPVYRLVPAGG